MNDFLKKIADILFLNRLFKQNVSLEIVASSVPADVVAAVDVNTVANEVYKHNFPTTPLWPKTIEVSNHAADFVVGSWVQGLRHPGRLNSPLLFGFQSVYSKVVDFMSQT